MKPESLLISVSHRTFGYLLTELLERTTLSTTHEAHPKGDWHYISYQALDSTFEAPVLKAAYHTNGSTKFQVDPLQLLNL